MFKKTKEFNKIMQELEAINILSKVAVFECFEDSVATFGYKDNETYHEFNFICDDGFTSEMKIEELLTLKRITYFNHCIFLEHPDKIEIIAEVMWSAYENSSLN
jgi:hypothetical protein